MHMSAQQLSPVGCCRALPPHPQAAKQQESDVNTDTCVLCGVGGSLLCCDGCPAAYHMRCLGETAKSLGEGDWLCPECGMGGRGEAAGLRIPVGARNKWKQPFHAMHGMLVRTAPPAVRSRGRHAEELGPTGESVVAAHCMCEWGAAPPTHAPLITAAAAAPTAAAVCAVVYKGEAAVEELKATNRVRSSDEVPLPSSFDAIHDPPKIVVGAQRRCIAQRLHLLLREPGHSAACGSSRAAAHD